MISHAINWPVQEVSRTSKSSKTLQNSSEFLKKSSESSEDALQSPFNRSFLFFWLLLSDHVISSSISFLSDYKVQRLLTLVWTLKLRVHKSNSISRVSPVKNPIPNLGSVGRAGHPRYTHVLAQDVHRPKTPVTKRFFKKPKFQVQNKALLKYCW